MPLTTTSILAGFRNAQSIGVPRRRGAQAGPVTMKATTSAR